MSQIIQAIAVRCSLVTYLSFKYFNCELSDFGYKDNNK